ncbi:GXWXG protein-domain-containing protein [Mycena epipterygia]|nr:GXWXG protein-domain-containing protein [Mycena epipterygia]
MMSPYVHVVASPNLALTTNYSTPTPEQAYLDLMKAGGQTREETATKIFDQLAPIMPTFLMGEWQGGDFDTGHPTTQVLKSINWAGKTFRTEEDVDPLIVYGEDGKRTFLDVYGRARVREMKFRGVVSAAMVYDDKPIIDHFRYVNEDTVAAMMDAKDSPAVYHFHLTRYRGVEAKM